MLKTCRLLYGARKAGCSRRGLELAQQLIAEQLAGIGMGTELGMLEGGIMWADFGAGGTEQIPLLGMKIK